MKRSIKSITNHSTIDGVIPGLRGQRAFPNQKIESMDPFVLLDQIGPQEVSNDFFVDGTKGAHPHRGFETLTFLFEGKMHHKDSMGNKELLESGSVQRMNAGKGIIHGGDFEGDSNKNTFHEVQLWINLPAADKMSVPFVQNVNQQQIPVLKKGNSELRIISGKLMNIQGPIDTIVPTKIVHVISPDNKAIEVDDLPSNYQLFVYVLKGKFTINNSSVHEYQTMQFNKDGNSIEINGTGEVLIIAGKPINEPVVTGGPFVMNTEEEINQAYADFKNGEFGMI